MEVFYDHTIIRFNRYPSLCLQSGLHGMSGAYGPSDEDESIATIHAALDAGINLIDTGDFYGMGDNEMLIQQALQGRSRQQVLLSVKFGGMRDPDGHFLGTDGRPQAVKIFLPTPSNALAQTMLIFIAQLVLTQLFRSRILLVRLRI